MAMGEANQIPGRPSLNLFGGFQLYDCEGQAISVSLRKAEALLAYLAVSAGQSASRETLAALLWGEFEQQRARQSLRQVLLSLTKAFAVCDSPVLRIESQQVSLVPGSIVVDVVEFEGLMREASPAALAEAAGLYRGDFLIGLRLDAPDFEDWQSGIQGRLHDLALKGLGELLDYQENTEEIGPAVATASQALRIDPFREDFHRALMRVYVCKGMRSSALTQYRLCREILQRELGVPPDEETTALYRSILDCGPEDVGDWSARSEATQASLPVSSTEGMRRQTLPEPRDALVGRDEEQERLRDLYEELAGGRGHVLAIVGEAGVGKTCLVEKFLDREVEDAAAVMHLRAREAEQGVALAPWAKSAQEAAEEAAGSVKSEALERLSLEAVRALSRWSTGPEKPATSKSPAAADRKRLYDTMVRLLQARCNGTRMVVVFEDLQWADNESLDLLLYAARACAASPVLFLCTLRAEDLGRHQLLSERLADLERDSLLSWMTLSPLDRRACGHLIANCRRSLGLHQSARVREDELWILSEGNPQVVVECLLELAADRGGSDDVPTRLPKSVRGEASRLRTRLGRAAQKLLEVACVLGPRCDYEMVAKVARMDEAETATAVEELVRGHVLAVEGQELVFQQARSCRALYEDMVPPRRKIIHAAVADMIEQLHAKSLEPHYQSLARHRREAGRLDEAVDAAVTAALVEMKRGAFSACRKILQQALRWQEALDGCGGRHPREQDLHFMLGCLAESEGDLTAARSAFKAAQVLASKGDKGLRSAEILIALARIECAAGERNAAFETLRRGLALAERTGGDAAWLPIETFVSRLHLVDGTQDSVLFRLNRRLQRSRSLGLKVDEAETLALRGLLSAIQGEFEQALADCAAGLAVAETSGCDATVAACLEAEGMTRLWQGDSQGAMHALERSTEIAEARGDLLRLYVLAGHRGIALLLSGHDADAMGLLESAIEMAEKLNTRFMLPLFKAWLAEAAAGNKGGDAAFSASREALRLAGQSNQAWAGSVALRALALAFTHRQSRDFDKAEQAIRAAIEAQTSLGLRFERARSMVVHAKILRARGEAARSSDVFSEAGSLFREMGMAAESARATTMAEALRPGA
jgi:DNA-binding SARP family transcriptional activator